jgi:hypothetical protein
MGFTLSIAPSEHDEFRVKRLLLTSPRRGEVEAEAPAKASGEGFLHAFGLAERPLTRRASDDARRLLPCGER